MLILGIETSCDETSAAVVKDGKTVLSNVVASSLGLHRKYNGIIPEIASRAHIESIALVVRQALEKAGKTAAHINAVCVTKCPGLMGSLLVGISFAKALSYALQKPLVGVNHLEAHLYAPFLSDTQARVQPALRRPVLPCVGLVVSGGHTSLYFIEKNFHCRLLGATVDDAAGEAFDKVAKILNLGYPGGPVIERAARKGNPRSINFSCDGSSELGFSFSGIKTAVLYKTKDDPSTSSFDKLRTSLRAGGRRTKDVDIAASFQKAVVDTLVEKSLAACRRKKSNTLVVGGGVAANRYLRQRLQEEAALHNIQVYFPDFALSLDNAAMIAGLGYQLYKRGKRSNYYLSPEPS